MIALLYPAGQQPKLSSVWNLRTEDFYEHHRLNDRFRSIVYFFAKILRISQKSSYIRKFFKLSVIIYIERYFLNRDGHGGSLSRWEAFFRGQLRLQSSVKNICKHYLKSIYRVICNMCLIIYWFE